LDIGIPIEGWERGEAESLIEGRVNVAVEKGSARAFFRCFKHGMVQQPMGICVTTVLRRHKYRGDAQCWDHGAVPSNGYIQHAAARHNGTCRSYKANVPHPPAHAIKCLLDAQVVGFEAAPLVP
jgi:hypothetical protein